MAHALEQKPTNITKGSGRHRAPGRNSGKHAQPQETPQVALSANVQHAPETPRTKRSRLGRLAGAAALGVLAALTPSQHTAAHDTVAPPVTAITPRVEGLAQDAITAYNQSERKHLDIGTTSDGGRDLTLNFTSAEHGPVTVTIDSADTQPDADGKPEPLPSAVTSLSAIGLIATGASSASFTRTAGGNWEVSKTYPAGGSQERVLTKLVQNQPVTELIKEGTGHLPVVQRPIPGNAMAAANINSSVALAGELIAASSAQAPVAPPPVTIV